MMGKQREVEDWLMGSGESADTATSGHLKNTNFQLIKGQQKPPEAIPESTDPPQQEEDWMFKTFSKIKKSNGQLFISDKVERLSFLK